tara:strand:- start:6015 stop:6587 length:573 start_codon:yes stop_codon:yes gene_type:complete
MIILNTPKEIHLTQAELKDKFDYDPDTGVLRFTTNECNRHNAYKGKRAGAFKYNGKATPKYRHVGVLKNQIKILEHRIIWKWWHGEEPPKAINHINQNGTDNRIKNLEKSGDSHNQKNCKRRSDNTTGHTNIYNYKAKKLLYAQVMSNSIAYRKPSISYKDRPYEEALKLALIDRDVLRKEHGFSELHGS